MSSVYRDGCDRCSAAKQLNEALRSENDALRKRSSTLDEQVRSVRNRRIVEVIARSLIATIGVGAVALSAVGLAAYVHGCAMMPKSPDPPPVCQDSVQIVSDGMTQRTCSPGSIMSVDQMDKDRVLVRCRCPQPTSIASATSSAEPVKE